MPTQLQAYSQMADHAATQITGSHLKWMAFLQTAARLYKYPYNEQLMIYAQKPESTACAEYSFWNERMGRYVRRGSKGIALIDASSDRPRLKYVFDVSDTGGGERSRRPFLWELREEHIDRVTAMLERNYDIPGDGNLADQLERLAAQLAVEYWNAQQRDILHIVDDSFLEEYDDFNIGVAFRNAATVSITYALMSRCGLEPDEYFSHEDFLSIFDFNTPATVTALGTAVSQINQQVLRQIEVTIKNYEREHSAERSATHGEQQVDLSTDRGLSDPRPDPERTGGAASRQVREDAEELPQGAPPDSLEYPASFGETVSASAGDRPDGTEPLGADDAGTGESGGRDGGPESQRPDEVGGADEQLQGAGGGDHSERTDFQLTPVYTPLQLSLFPSEEEQIATIAQAESVPITPFAFSFAQEDIDHVLRLGGNNDNSRQRVSYEYLKEKPLEEIAAFLSREYEGGSGLVTDNGRLSAWFSEEGIRISHGSTARYAASAQIVSWQDAAVRVGELLEQGRFATNVELAETDGYVRGQLANSLLDLRRDFDEPAREQGYLPSMEPLLGGGYPEMRAKLSDALAKPEFLSTITAEYEQFLGAYRENRDLLRFRYHRADELLNRLRDLALPQRAYSTDMAEAPQTEHFITEDEINATLARRSSFEGGKGRIYAYFTEKHTPKEQAAFLKKEYGIGGHNGAIPGSFSSWEDYSGKGIVLKKPGCSDVSLSWSNVARRITELIKKDRYLTPEEHAKREEMERKKAEAEQPPAVDAVAPVPNDISMDAPQYEAVQGQETAPIPSFLITQDNIDAAIQAWNGDIASKHAVVRQMATHARDKETAEFLRAEYGGDLAAFPVAAGGAATEVPWPKVQRRIYQLMEADRFYTQEKQDNLDDIDPIAIRENLAQAGIVNGEVIDPAALENSPIVQAVNAAAGQLAQEERPPVPELDFESVAQTMLERVMQDADYQEALMNAESRADLRNPCAWALEQAIRDHEQDEPDAYHRYFHDVDWRDRLLGRVLRMSYASKPQPEQAQAEQSASPPPIFFVEWETARLDIDLSRYADLNIIGYNKDGVEYALGRSGGITYTTQTTTITSWGEVLGSERIPADIRRQIVDYHEGKLTDEQVRETYLAALGITPPQPEIPAQNFRITDDNLGAGGPKVKYNANIEAIRTLRQIEAEDRNAAPEEQEILSRYVGWGGISQAFDPDHQQWTRKYGELKTLLSDEEYASARASTLNAHYTSPTVIKAIYEAVGNMGFRTGNILEPACGVGNFFGLLPEEMQNAKLYGTELDSITGRIAKLLYPKSDIQVAGFETTDRRDFYDLAVGNVPFGSYKVPDKPYDKLGFSIHDYFFAKTIDQVRPGGVIAFVTSRYTMDKRSPEVRRHIAQRADLLGAIRLPNNAFKNNAGTEVTSDILFLQKRHHPIDIMPDWVHLGETEDGIAVNSYFADHPEMVLGTLQWDDRMYGDNKEVTCEPFPDADLAQQLHEAVSRIGGEIAEAELPDLGEGEAIDTSIPADPDVKNYSYTIVDGEVYYRENSRMVKPELNATAIGRVKGMVELRDCVQELIDQQMDSWTPDAAIRSTQSRLNRLYDNFNNQYGLINSRGNALAFADDSSYYLLCSLEILDEDGNLERKADMFTKRTIKQARAVTSVDTASEALAVSIAEKARVDMPYMAALSGKTEEALADELQGVIFRLPQPVDEDGRPRYVTADEYLSGNIRQKLAAARQAAELSPVFASNVEPLEAAMPKDLEASEIDVRLGATWLDTEYIQAFMEELFDPPHYLRDTIRVNFVSYTAEWNITGKSSVSWNDVAAYTTYGTDRANAYRILEDTLNLRDIRIYDTIEDADGRERRVLNKDATTLAQQKQQAIKDAFRDWIWKDPERRQALVRKYNDLFNSSRPREYDGRHITFGGISPDITLREHQLNAIAHILYGGNTLLAHEVGAGKTFEMVAAAMEAKRLGLCSKSLFAVPNHLTEQWASEFLRLYPSANILVATKKDFESRNRKKFCSRIATGDYDAIVIGHSQFERIPVSKERQERLLQEQIWEIEDGLQELKHSNAERFTIKQLEKTKKNLEARMKSLHSSDRKDDVVTFEQLGVDRLFVDEAHSFKNLFLYTKMRNVAGLSTTDAQKSSDMLLKCRYMDEVTGGKGVIFATGTPVSNSMTELYTMQRYLQHDVLRKNNLAHFDCWASTFGETVTAIELAPEGSGYRARTRFAKFFNLPELMAMFKETADIKTADQLNLPVPKVVYHNEVSEPTEHQEALVQELSERAAEVHSGKVPPTVDNMLKITSDGRKLGLDQRIINPMLPDDPRSKANKCVDNIIQVWQDGQADKLTQLVFCDISTPKARAAANQEQVARLAGDKTVGGAELHALGNIMEDTEAAPPFSVYEDIRDKLIARGIPPEQVAFIHDANTEVRKKELFAKVRSGQVRVLMGSTFKMGEGMNVQDRLFALHDLDCPWRPGDLEQRSGRIIRQGNQNPEVHIYRYVTEGTFDSYLWQTVENKRKFISQIMTSKSPVRSCEDVDETALSYAEIKALCAGNPLIKEKMDLDIDVARLRLLKADHQSQQYKLEDNLLKHFPEQIEQSKGYIAGFHADMATLAAHPLPEMGFVGMTVKGDALTDKDNAGAAILEACKEIKGKDNFEIGSYRGFAMSLSVENFGRDFVLTLKDQMSHSVTLGKDARGNLTRIDNALSQMPERLQSVQTRLDNLYNQVAAAKAEIGKPFPQEAELAGKSARLAVLNTQLDLDTGAGWQAPDRVIAKSDRPSVLDSLKKPLPQKAPEKKSRPREQEAR